MKNKNKSQESRLRPVATKIIKDALDQHFKTLPAGEWLATAVWFLALSHGVSGEIYDGIDSKISIRCNGKKGKGLSVMLWADMETIYSVDIFTEDDNRTVKAIYCLDHTEKSITTVDGHSELVEWLISKFDHEVMPLNEPLL